MKVIIENEVPVKQKLEGGDMIKYKDSDNIFIITIARINGSDTEISLNALGLDGIFWASNPQKAIDEGDAILYRQDQYELVLRKKS